MYIYTDINCLLLYLFKLYICSIVCIFKYTNIYILFYLIYCNKKKNYILITI